MYIRVITPPAQEVVTLARARLQLKIDADIPPVAPATAPTSERDPEIEDAIKTAREKVQQYLGRAVGAQTLELVMTGWQSVVEIPLGGVTSITSVDYTADDGEHQLATENYALYGGDKPFVTISAAPALASTPENVRIRFEAGYTADTVPGPVKSAMLLLITDLVQNPSRQTDKPLSENAAFADLLSEYRLGMGV
jgi:uncharacterized phiE125 gp8 family phage protein